MACVSVINSKKQNISPTAQYRIYPSVWKQNSVSKTVKRDKFKAFFSGTIQGSLKILTDWISNAPGFTVDLKKLTLK